MIGVGASVELLAADGASVLSILASALMVLLPAAALAATWLQWAPMNLVCGGLCWIAAGIAVLVATSLRPLAHVKGMQSGGLIVVATGMLVVPVLRGGFRARALTGGLFGMMGGEDDAGPGWWRDDRR